MNRSESWPEKLALCPVSSPDISSFVVLRLFLPWSAGLLEEGLAGGRASPPRGWAAWKGKLGEEWVWGGNELRVGFDECESPVGCPWG